eukprot:1184756-Prorocentrum_minimum.AAC.5
MLLDRCLLGPCPRSSVPLFSASAALTIRMLSGTGAAEFTPLTGEFAPLSGEFAPLTDEFRFLAALARRSEAEGTALFSVPELFALADEISLNVRDVDQFIEQLNEHGDLLKVTIEPSQMNRQMWTSSSSSSTSTATSSR